MRHFSAWADMNSKISRTILIVEALVFAVPVTGLLGLAVAVLPATKTNKFWPWLAMDLVTTLAVLSVAAGWWLIFKALRGGAGALHATHRAWWVVASLGLLLVLGALASLALPSSPPYLPAALFREHLQRCILGAPLVIILTHLWIEARFHRRCGQD